MGEIQQSNHLYVARADTASPHQHHTPLALEQQAGITDQVRRVASSSLDYVGNSDDGTVTAGNGSVAVPLATHKTPDEGREIPVWQVSSDGQHPQESNTLQQGADQGIGDVITITRCQQGHQGDVSPPEKRDQSREDALAAAGRASTTEEAPAALVSRNHCPRHAYARWVRFDPSGQAWCDKLDCWDCYRLMKIGKALEYLCLTDVVGEASK